MASTVEPITASEPRGDIVDKLNAAINNLLLPYPDFAPNADIDRVLFASMERDGVVYLSIQIPDKSKGDAWYKNVGPRMTPMGMLPARKRSK